MTLQQQLASPTTVRLGELKGFEDINSSDNYTRLLEKFRQKIKSNEDEAAKDQKLYFWISFLVTALTAGSTLVSSIQAARKGAAADAKHVQLFAIIIALLTFSSTLANFSSTHFNELKTEESKKVVELQTLRNQFQAGYNKTPAADKSSVIETYEQRLE